MTQNNHTIGIPVDKPHYRRAFILLHLICTEIKTIRLQQSRIEQEKETDDLTVLFADIHFLFVSLGNLRKLLKAMNEVLSDDTDFKLICDNYLPYIDRIGLIRNHLEHILDGRLDGFGHKGVPLAEPNMFGNLFGDEYNFGGDKVNIKETFEMIDSLETDLKAWNKKVLIYPLWY